MLFLGGHVAVKNTHYHSAKVTCFELLETTHLLLILIQHDEDVLHARTSKRKSNNLSGKQMWK